MLGSWLQCIGAHFLYPKQTREPLYYPVNPCLCILPRGNNPHFIPPKVPWAPVCPCRLLSKPQKPFSRSQVLSSSSK